jgi:hypothetical protein
MNASDLCVQRLIDYVPDIGRSCVVAVDPDALLQDVIAIPPMLTVRADPST